MHRCRNSQNTLPDYVRIMREKSYEYLQQTGALAARFLVESLTAAFPNGADTLLGQVVHIKSPKLDVRTTQDVARLDLSGLTDLFSRLLFTRQDDQLSQERLQWFEYLGIRNAESELFKHPQRKKLYNAVEDLRRARNHLSHQPVGTEHTQPSTMDVEHLASVTAMMTLLSRLSGVIERRPSAWSPELAHDLSTMVEELRQHIQRAPDKPTVSVSTGRRSRVLLAAAIAVAIVVAIVGAIVGAFVIDAMPESEKSLRVALVVLSPPPPEALDSVLAALPQDYGSVVLSLISERGRSRDSLILDASVLKTADTRRKLALFVRDAPEISSVRAVVDVHEVVRQMLVNARNTANTHEAMLVITVGSSGSGLDDQFVQDYNSGAWHATPRGFYDAWSSLRDQGRLLRPVYIFPATANMFDRAMCESFAIEGFAATAITVPTWITQ